MINPQNTTLYPDIDVWAVIDLITNLYNTDNRDKRIKFLTSVASYGFTQGYLTELQKKYVYRIQVEYNEYWEKVLNSKGVEDDKEI